MRQETLLKIIGLMREDLDRGQTIMGISKKLDIGYRPAHMHITEMEKEGMIRSEKVGAAKQCRLNLQNPLTRHQLMALDMFKAEKVYEKNAKLKAIIDGLIEKVTNQYLSKVQSIVLFGSQAKGSATKQSDIDLLFIVNDLKDKEVREAIERECAGYQYSHNIRVSPLITDIVEFKKMLEAKELNVGKEIRKDGISLFGHELFWRII
ncbi:MAG: nucleotidyltransferase domain-containing protein [Nanoarchaeota archaeon]